MDTKKPWEETWELTHLVVHDRETGLSIFASGCEVDPGIVAADHERLRIAACAPEAIRLLLEAEWAVPILGNDICLWCRRFDYDGHAPDCRWLALMRRAGVRG